MCAITVVILLELADSGSTRQDIVRMVLWYALTSGSRVCLIITIFTGDKRGYDTAVGIGEMY